MKERATLVEKASDAVELLGFESELRAILHAKHLEGRALTVMGLPHREPR